MFIANVFEVSALGGFSPAMNNGAVNSSTAKLIMQRTYWDFCLMLSFCISPCFCLPPSCLFLT